jgi:hypothetical protein
MRKTQFVLAVVALVLLAVNTAAEVPQLINYQGRLTDSLGNPVADGDYQITFNIWNWWEGGALLWTSDAQTIYVENGLFTYTLGSQQPLQHSLFADSARWLGIRINNDEEIMPRTKLTPAPYAYHALRSDTSGYASAVANQGINNQMIMDTTIGFEKLAHNEGEPGDVLTFMEGKATGYWVRSSVTELINSHCPPGWLDEGSIVTLYNNHDKVGAGIVVPDARLHVHSNPATGTDPFHVSISDGSGDPDTRLVMTTSGNVGIGITDPGNHQLAVQSEDGDGVNGATVHVKNTNISDGSAMRLQNNSSSATISIWQQGGGDVLTALGPLGQGLKVLNDGKVTCPVLTITGGSDVAEPFDVIGNDNPEKGSVVVIDHENPGKLRLSSRAYDTRVAGVISGAGGVQPGITLTQEGTLSGKQYVAISGRVYCLADATYGEIQAGDMLTTSPTKGHAMKASDRQRTYGTIIGKAMTNLADGRGLVLILVNLQ